MALNPRMNLSRPAVWFEALLAALVLFAMDGLAHLRLSPLEFMVVWLPWLAGLGLAVVAARLWPGVSGLALQLVQFLFPALAMFVVNLGLRPPLPLGAILAAAVGYAGLAAVWRAWLARAERGGATVGGEALRLSVIGGMSVYVMLPMFSDRWVGGVDARWYAYMLHDYLEQLRAGEFPVAIGQGEFAYNGGVHPFRSAPVFLWFAGLWDAITGRTLPVMALQHLAAITGALLGALGMYAVIGRLAAPHRWLAAGVAVIYVTSPAFLGPLYFADQYMTYLTLAALPILLQGNIQILAGGGRGWIWLAVGLAAVWFCHPPVAILATLATGVIQGGGVLLERTPAPRLRQLAKATGLFLVLAGHYFIALAEVPSPLQPSVALMVAQLAAGAIAVAGLVRAAVWREHGGWFAFVVGSTGLWWVQRGWVWPLLISAAAVAGFCQLARNWRWFGGGTAAWPVVFGGLVGGLFLAAALGSQPYPAFSVDTLALLSANAKTWLAVLLPIDSGSSVGVIQPGWGVLALAAILAVRAFAGGDLKVQLLFTTVFLLGISGFDLPGVSAYWLAHLPRALVEMTGLPLVNRLLPPLAAVACVGGSLAVAQAVKARPGAGRAGIALVLLLAGWQAAQAWPYLQRGWLTTHTRVDTANQFRTENAVLDRFAYDLMMMPEYVSHGKTDPRIEARLSVQTPEVRIGPDETARRMEAIDVREQVVTAAVEPTAPAWLNLDPVITLAPGEHVLLRFEFLPKDYDGWLIFKGRHTYREYRLPDSGWRHAFGVGPTAAKTISLWNSGAETEEVRMSFQRPAASGEFGDFARLFISPYRPEHAPVRVWSLRPYRVEVAMPTAGSLETIRAYVPGYVARVNGEPVGTDISPRWLVRVPLPAGRHHVELEFVGTAVFRLSWWISAAAWVVVLVWAGRRRQENP